MIKKKSRNRRCCRLPIHDRIALAVSSFLLVFFLLNYGWLVPLDSDSNKAGQEEQQQQQQQQHRLKQLPSLQHGTSVAQSEYGGAFVHMGKTGGSTISVLLRHGCHSFMKHPCRNISNESPASQRIKSYYHVPEFGLLPQTQHDFYLVSIREPLDRVISSFVYDHYWNRLARNNETDATTTMDLPTKVKLKTAFSCFPTLEQFASFFDTDPDGNDDPTKFHYPYPKFIVNADSCRDLARAVLYGKVKAVSHLYFGYKRIQSFLMESEKNKKNHNLVVYVTRQQHLQHDWEAVNQLLGQQLQQLQSNYNAVVLDPLPHRRSVQQENGHSVVLPVTRQLSQRGTQLLCRALIKGGEYQAYLWFLQQAQNLHPDDVSDSIQYAQDKCGPEIIATGSNL